MSYRAFSSESRSKSYRGRLVPNPVPVDPETNEQRNLMETRKLRTPIEHHLQVQNPPNTRNLMRRMIRLQNSNLRAYVIITSLLVLVSLAVAPAATVPPIQVTLGTTFSVSGSDFGTRRGTVFIGFSPCEVVAWNDTEVVCVMKVPMPQHLPGLLEGR